MEFNDFFQNLKKKKNISIGVMSIDNSNNGNSCNLTCPANKGIYFYLRDSYKYTSYKMKIL